MADKDRNISRLQECILVGAVAGRYHVTIKLSSPKDATVLCVHEAIALMMVFEYERMSGQLLKVQY